MTRRVFKVSLVLLLVIVGLSWFVLTSLENVDNHQVDNKLTVDPDKVKEDARKAQEKVKELNTKAKNEGHEDERQPADSVRPDRE